MWYWLSLEQWSVYFFCTTKICSYLESIPLSPSPIYMPSLSHQKAKQPKCPIPRAGIGRSRSLTQDTVQDPTFMNELLMVLPFHFHFSCHQMTWLQSSHWHYHTITMHIHPSTHINCQHCLKTIHHHHTVTHSHIYMNICHWSMSLSHQYRRANHHYTVSYGILTLLNHLHHHLGQLYQTGQIVSCIY